MRRLYQQMLADGNPPRWTPAVFAGFDLHGEGQIGAYHPLHHVLYRLLPLDVALNLEILLGYVGALTGMHWFLRRLGLAPHAALFGAMTFALGGFMLTHYPHVNMIGVVAHMPWILACFDVLVLDDGSSRRAAAYAGIAVLVGSQLLLGFPQGVWWTLFAGGAFVLWRAHAAGRLGRAVAPALAVATGILIGGIQLLPTLASVSRSVRIHVQTSFLLGYSLHPWNILQLWSPYTLQRRAYSNLDRLQFHEFALYPAAFLVLAPAWLWVRRASLARRRSIVVFASIFAAVMFVLALGRYGELARILLYLPGVGSFRAPARYIMLMQFALAMLAAIAIEDLAQIRATGAVALSRTAVSVLASFAALSVLTLLILNLNLVRPSGDVRFAPALSALPGTLAVCGATVLLFLASRGARWAVPWLIVLTAIDLGAWGLTYIHRTLPMPLSGFAMGMRGNDTGQPLRLVGPSTWSDVPLSSGYQLVGGYVGLYPQTTLSWDGDAFRRLAGARGRFDKALNVTELTDGVARARMLTDVYVSSEPARDIARIDLERTALVGAPLPPLDGALGATRVLIDRPGHLRVQTQAQGRQLLALSERYDVGWIATIDERLARAIAVNGDFLGIVVDAGAHVVDLRFAPRAFTLGVIVSAAGILALAAGVVVMSRLGRISSPRASCRP